MLTACIEFLKTNFVLNMLDTYMNIKTIFFHY